MLENWRSKDVRRDPEGFLKAQQAEREWMEAEANKHQEQDDLERFTRTFVAECGNPPVTQRPSGAAPAASTPPRARRAKAEAAHREMHQSRMRAV